MQIPFIHLALPDPRCQVIVDAQEFGGGEGSIIFFILIPECEHHELVGPWGRWVSTGGIPARSLLQASCVFVQG